MSLQGGNSGSLGVLGFEQTSHQQPKDLTTCPPPIRSMYNHVFLIKEGSKRNLIKKQRIFQEPFFLYECSLLLQAVITSEHTTFLQKKPRLNVNEDK